MGAAAVLTLAGCAGSHVAGPRPDADPDMRLGELEAALAERRAEGTSCLDHFERRRPSVDCDRIRYEVDRLALEFPRHPPVLMASARLAYLAGASAQAQATLDSLRALRPDHVEAASLRARIALESGNHRLARRILDEGIQIHPDAPSLYEALAAVAYVSGDADAARGALDAAALLGAPAWRVAFNRGLVEEGAGARLEAIRWYEEALAGNPAYEPARARLRGLGASP